ncbi:MAG TPA: M56 family metallopeptidase [Armatimonadaceae bacterium]|nr:M56 family metallopeptidase [Armatimonadaceae bacterium]
MPPSALSHWLPSADYLAGSLVSALWRASFQGLVLLAVVWALSVAMRRRIPPRARFWLWWLACAKLLTAVLVGGLAISLPILPAYHATPSSWLSRLAPPDRIVSAPRRDSPAPSRGEPAGARPDPAVAPDRVAAAPHVAAPTRAPSAAASTAYYPSPAFYLASAYLVGLLLALAGQARAYHRMRRLRERCAPEPAFDGRVRRLAQRFGVRPPPVRMSPAGDGPLVTGLRRPVIIVPFGFDRLPDAEAEMALAHEIAHIRRRDLPLAVVPGLVRTLFFFLPLAHVAASECAAAREEDCDAFALEATGATPAGYAALLVRLVSSNSGLAIGMAAASFQRLRRRLGALGDSGGRHSGPSRAVRLLSSLALASMAAAVLPWRIAASGGAHPEREGPAESRPPRYAVTDLGTLGGNYSAAFGLNDRGDVVGAANVYPRGGMGHAFLFRDGRLRDLGAGSAYRHSLAEAVNERGLAAASAYRSSYRTGEQFAFVWNGRSRRYIGSLPGFRHARAADINDRTQVAGTALSGRTDADGATVARAFLWHEGRIRDLGTLGGRYSHALALNEAGQVVGKADTPDNLTRAFLYEDGTMRDLGTLGGSDSTAYDVSEGGLAVGTSDTAGGARRAFAIRAGSAMEDLGTLPGFAASAAYGVAEQDAGVAGSLVVGEATAEGGLSRAVTWLQDGGGTWRAADLNDLLDADSGQRWLLRSARAVNARGQIVGYGTVNGRTHAFLLTPKVMGPASAAADMVSSPGR